MKNIDGTSLIKQFSLDEFKSALGNEFNMFACVHKIKSMGQFAFVMLRTGRYVIQSVYEPETCSDDIDSIKEGCYINVSGTVREEPRANYGFELLLSGFSLLSTPAEEYPLHVSARKLGCSMEANLKYRSAALRNPNERAAFKISEGVCEGFRRFMLANNFTEIHTPKIVAAGAEGGANIFKLKYFGEDAYLAQSPQFYKQTCVAIFDRVFEIDPVYRAEKHNTTRHLNEYTGLDFEMGFINDMYDVMAMETAMLKYIFAFLGENYQNELNITGAKLPVFDEIPSVTFLEAIEIVGGNKNKHDLDPQDEVKLCEYFAKEKGSEFVFITHFPSLKRPFYVMDNKEDPRVAESFDLLFRGLEITTGGQRIHDYNEQVGKMKRMNMNPEEFESYLQIHKYGMPPHGGLGIGLERIVMKLLDLPNIRQASLFPRDINHLEP
ncbi:MAG: aspartate--tRNA(Asn) ligase [Oscillospiraceae bacterium]|nr:aspartate--tRNA(Asn) ligase [Oscillospiraceae bacterium]